MSALKEIGRVPASDYSKHGLAKGRLILMIKKMMEIRLYFGCSFLSTDN